MTTKSLLEHLVEKYQIVLDELTGIDVLPEREVSFLIPISRYAEGTRYAAERNFFLGNGNIEESDFNSGKFVRIKGYSGTFRVSISMKLKIGFYHVQIKREEIPEGYKGKVVRITNFER